MFGKNKHRRCAYSENVPAPFTVRQVPARDLLKGMTFVAAPKGCRPATTCCGHWPVITEDAVVQEAPDGRVYAYWATDEPGECGGERSATHKEHPDTLITVAAGRTVR